MSLCIAAECQTEKGDPRIVLCSDTRMEDEVAGAEIEDKLSLLIPRWTALISAEDMSRADELVDVYRDYFTKKQPNHRNALREFKKPALDQRKFMLDETSKRMPGVAMPYAEFIATGPATFGLDRFYQLHYGLTSEDLKCQVILSGFLNDEAHIFLIDRDASVRYMRYFAVCGSGTYVARAMLSYRKQKGNLSVEKTIYHLYEAKKIGQRAPGVGKETHIDIMRPNRREGYKIQTVSKAGMRFLKNQLEKYGPKQIPPKIEFERKFFEDF